MSTMKIRFKFDQNETKSIDFDIKITIEDMIKIYLRETNSKEILNPKEILFIYGDKILNSKIFLKNKIENIFNRQKLTVTIKDKKKIIGGIAI